MQTGSRDLLCGCPAPVLDQAAPDTQHPTVVASLCMSCHCVCMAAQSLLCKACRPQSPIKGDA